MLEEASGTFFATSPPSNSSAIENADLSMMATVKQAERNELNLPAQQKRCEDWCAAQGISVLRVFVAEGESAWKSDRPTLQEAIDFIRQSRGKVTHFVVQDSSRFSRNMEGKAQAKAALTRLEVKLISVDEPQLDDSPVGKLMDSMATAINEFYSHNLSSKVRHRFQFHREQGRWLHMAPLGYRNVQENGIKTIVPDDSAPLVRQAFEMMATGGYSSDAVREFVTAAGLRMKKGRQLSRQTFSTVLKNPAYCGLITHKGKIYQGKFPALVSEELWQSVQDALRGKRKAVPKKTVDESFPLRGFVKCGHCFAKLTSGNPSSRGKKYPRYWCWNEQCKKTKVRRENLEADWLDFLTYMQPAFDALVNVLPVLANANAHKRVEDAEKKQRQLAAQLEEKNRMRLSIFESYNKGNMTLEEFRRMMDMIAADIEQVETARRAFVEEAEVALQLTADTTRTTIPAKALWASAHLTDKLTVQNALFPMGICYRTDIRFFEPPTHELQALVFKMLLSNVAEHEGEEIKSGRGEWI